MPDYRSFEIHTPTIDTYREQLNRYRKALDMEPTRLSDEALIMRALDDATTRAEEGLARLVADRKQAR